MQKKFWIIVIPISLASYLLGHFQVFSFLGRIRISIADPIAHEEQEISPTQTRIIKNPIPTVERTTVPD